MSRPILPQSEPAPPQPLSYPDPPTLQQYRHQPPQLDHTQYDQFAQDGAIVSPTAAHVGHDLSAPSSATPSKPTYAKRGKITIVACVPCRKRKTKCDGQRPSCTQCSSRNGPCSYDMTDDQRKLTYLRDSVDQLQSDKSLLEQLLSTIQTASQEEAREVFRRLRAGGDLQQVAEEIQAGKLLSGVGGASAVRQNGDTEQSGQSARRLAPRLDHYERLVRQLALADPKGSSDIVSRLKASEDIPSILRNISAGSQDSTQLIQRRTPSGVEGDFSSQASLFGMVKGAEMRNTHASIASEFIIGNVGSHWSNVTQDSEFIQHLLNLYFTWQHSFFQSFPEDLFRADFATGNTKYCSSSLVNAICAAGCMLSLRSGTDTMVDQFYDEATRQLKDTEKPTITTVAALYLTSYVEGSKGKLSALWMSSGASALMAVDLSLQLKRTVNPDRSDDAAEEAQKEEKARCHAFWGCFHVDQITSFTLGRLPNFNVHGVTVDLPAIQKEFDQEPWHPYEGNERPDVPCARSSTFRSCADLSMIINGTLQMYFAPTVPLSGSLLVAEYEKYLEWKRTLPPLIANTERSPPHVLCLHMYYHTAILLLFRPFLKAKITSRTDLVPRQLAREAADRISDIWELHKKLYEYSGIYMFQIHCLLTACTIHIISIPTPSPTSRFREACRSFHDLSQRHEWARSALDILQGLATKWNLILPKDAEDALWKDAHTRPESPRPGPPSFTQPTDPQSAFSVDQHDLQVGSPLPPTSNIDPALSSSMQSSNHGANQPGSKRSASQLSSSHNSPPSTRSSRQDSFPLGQKRPRMIASAQTQMTPGAVPSTTMSSNPTNNRLSEIAQQYQDPANYLYSPLVNQPAPFLRPVRHSSSASTGSTMSQSQQHNNNAVNVNATAPTAQMQQPQSNVKHEGPDTSQAASVLAAQGTSAQTRARQAEIQGQYGGVDQVQAITSPLPVNPNMIEGLSFSDDFRDPFMGFLEVE